MTFNFDDQIILLSTNKQGKWSCAVCGRNTGSNSVKCIMCKHCPERGRPTRGRNVSSRRTKSASTPLVFSLSQQEEDLKSGHLFYGLPPPRPRLLKEGSVASCRRCGKQPWTHVVLCYMYT